MFIARFKIPLLVLVLCTFVSSVASGQETATKEATQEKTQEKTELELADGSLVMQAPASWNTVEPKFSMIEAEYSVPKPAEEEEGDDARLTIMSAGGGVQGNVDRWISQFSQPDGSSTADVTKVEEIEVAGMPVHMVDITGTFAERAGGPTSPPKMKPDFRMLAAIVEMEGNSYFIKFYGHQATIDANAEMFTEFVKSIEKK